MKTIARDKFQDKLVKSVGTTAGVAFALNPFFGMVAVGTLTTYTILKTVNTFVGTVPHGKTDRLPPWRFMDDDWYLTACIAEQWMGPVEEMYDRSIEIDTNWTSITSFIDEAEGVVDDFDKSFIDGSSVEDFQALFDSLTEVEELVSSPEMLELIERANQIRIEVDNYLKQALMAQYRAIQYMRERVYNGQGRRKKFGIAWPKSVQQIYHTYCYDQSLDFKNYNPSK